MTCMLVGFVGEYFGSEKWITYHLPVVRKLDGKFYVPLRFDWTEADLRLLSSWDFSDFVNRFDDEQAIEPGQVVWMTGEEAFTEVSSSVRWLNQSRWHDEGRPLDALGSVVSYLEEWRVFEGNAKERYRVGRVLEDTAGAYLDLRQE